MNSLKLKTQVFHFSVSYRAYVATGRAHSRFSTDICQNVLSWIKSPQWFNNTGHLRGCYSHCTEDKTEAQRVNWLCLSTGFCTAGIWTLFLSPSVSWAAQTPPLLRQEPHRGQLLLIFLCLFGWILWFYKLLNTEPTSPLPFIWSDTLGEWVIL